MIGVLIAIPIAWYLTLCTHELSHYIAAKAQGLTVTAFKVWPHTHKGRLYFGRVGIKGKAHSDFFFSPLYSALILGLPCLLLGSFIHRGVLVLAVMQLADVLWWVRGYYGEYDGTDGYRWRRMVN